MCLSLPSPKKILFCINFEDDALKDTELLENGCFLQITITKWGGFYLPTP